ncbi:hypothetical protein JRO89_XS10G0005700 [Xanthoceras sorbifolium]|uniref:Uncharacterized protein n=1 Tax=Xanthoceras sorbifolium TaxID=99658 RepID=A0ABQ8HH88_9ROSI|nr:hypothetical protein JRO89_XS10G0005700 [Xanthoceras sorbifolium]
MSKLNRVCVYCGSNSGTRQVYIDATIDLGRQLVISLSLSLSLSRSLMVDFEAFNYSWTSYSDRGVQEGFISPSSGNILISAKNAQELLQRMEEYTLMHDQATSIQKWNI